MYNIQKLQSYMLSNNNFITYNNTKKSVENTKNTINTKNTKNTINTKNTNKIELDLFWCIYSCIKKDDNYDKTFKEKNKFIIEFLEQIKKDKTLLKENKLQYIKIEQNLLYDKNISLAVVNAICLYYQINILYVLNAIYYKFIGDIESNSFFLVKNINKKYLVLKEPNEEIINTIFNNLYYVSNMNKIIYNVNYYKISELKEIAKKLNVSVVGKKNDIYIKIKKILEQN